MRHAQLLFVKLPLQVSSDERATVVWKPSHLRQRTLVTDADAAADSADARRFMSPSHTVEFIGVVGFHIRSLISHLAISDEVRLVEGVTGELLQPIE